MAMFNPNDPLPDFAAQNTNLAQQKRVAEALRKQVGTTPGMGEGQMVSGHYVAPSWAEGLAPILAGYQANRAENEYGATEKANAEQLANVQRTVRGEMPQDVPAKMEMGGGDMRLPGSPAAEVAPAQDVNRDQVLKHTLRMYQAGLGKEADLYKEGAIGEIAQKEKVAENTRHELAQARAAAEKRAEEIEYKKGRDKQESEDKKRHEENMMEMRKLAVAAANNKPQHETPVQSKERQGMENEVQSAAKRESLLAEATELIPKSVGSLLEKGKRAAGAPFNIETEAGKASAKLEVLGNDLMLHQARFPGSVSDREAKLYKQMAGDLANPDKPMGERMAALDTIKRMHREDSASLTKQVAQYNQYRSMGPGYNIDAAGIPVGREGGASPTQAAGGKVGNAAPTVVRTGKDAKGRKVEELSDGTVRHAP